MMPLKASQSTLRSFFLRGAPPPRCGAVAPSSCGTSGGNSPSSSCEMGPSGGSMRSAKVKPPPPRFQACLRFRVGQMAGLESTANLQYWTCRHQFRQVRQYLDQTTGTAMLAYKTTLALQNLRLYAAPQRSNPCSPAKPDDPREPYPPPCTATPSHPPAFDQIQRRPQLRGHRAEAFADV